MTPEERLKQIALILESDKHWGWETCAMIAATVHYPNVSLADVVRGALAEDKSS